MSLMIEINDHRMKNNLITWLIVDYIFIGKLLIKLVKTDYLLIKLC